MSIKIEINSGGCIAFRIVEDLKPKTKFLFVIDVRGKVLAMCDNTYMRTSFDMFETRFKVDGGKEC